MCLNGDLYFMMSPSEYESDVTLNFNGSEVARLSTASGLGVCEWSPEGLYHKSVSLIPNTDEKLEILKKKMN